MEETLLGNTRSICLCKPFRDPEFGYKLSLKPEAPAQFPSPTERSIVLDFSRVYAGYRRLYREDFGLDREFAKHLIAHQLRHLLGLGGVPLDSKEPALMAGGEVLGEILSTRPPASDRRTLKALIDHVIYGRELRCSDGYQLSAGVATEQGSIERRLFYCAPGQELAQL